MPDSSERLTRPDLDAARASIRVDGPPLLTSIGLEDRPDGTYWDKPAPTLVPGDKGIPVPAHLGELAAFFQEIILSESFLLELCFDRVYQMVETAINRRIIGTDGFAGDGEGSVGGPFTPTHYAGIAVPMTVELYKSVCGNIAGQEDKFKQIMERCGEKAEELRQEAIRARQKSPISKGGIVLP